MSNLMSNIKIGNTTFIIKDSEARTKIENLKSQVNSLASGSPLVATSTSEMTDTSRVYVNTTNGNWYYHNGDEWVSGGTYQSTAIADNTIIENMLNETLKRDLKRRIDNKDYLHKNKIINLNLTTDELQQLQISENTGLETGTTNTNAVSTKEYIYFPNGADINININTGFTFETIKIFYYDKDKNFLEMRKIDTQNHGMCFKNPIANYIKLLCYSNDGLTPENMINNVSFEFTFQNINKNIEYVEGKNKVNKVKSVTGYINDTANGKIQLDTNYKTTDFIKVEVGKTYTIGKFRKFIMYDKNYKVLPETMIKDTTSNYTFVAEFDGYIRFSYQESYGQSIIMVEGSEIGGYEEYTKYLPTDIYQKEQAGNVLYGKKWVACGDSFTEGDFSNSLTNDYIFEDGLYAGQKKVYPFFIGRRNNMTVINEAKSGTTMAHITNRTDGFSNNRYKEIPLDTDYITLWFGINDGNYDVPIGTIDDAINTTFYGAWNIVLEYLITNHPLAKIGIVVTNGASEEYTTAIRNVARKWGIPYLDLEKDYQVPLMLRVKEKSEVCSKAKELRNNAFFVNNTGVDSEGVNRNNWHPNEKAHEYQSTFIENWLRSL